VGYDPNFDACLLKRAIQRESQDSLALQMQSGDLHEGDFNRMDRGDKGMVFYTAVGGEVVEA